MLEIFIAQQRLQRTRLSNNQHNIFCLGLFTRKYMSNMTKHDAFLISDCNNEFLLFNIMLRMDYNNTIAYLFGVL